MDNRPRVVLQQLIDEHGDMLYGAPKQCRSFLLDELEGTCEAEVNVLILALECGLVEDMRSAMDSRPAELLLPQLTQKLRSRVPFDDRAAYWAVESWALVLGVKVQPTSGQRPAPQPTWGEEGSPDPGQVELWLPLSEMTVAVQNGDRVIGDVAGPLMIESPLGGRLKVPSQEFVGIDDDYFTFADGTVLQGLLAMPHLEVQTSRRVRRLSVDRLQPLHYHPEPVNGTPAEKTCFGTHQGNIVMGDLRSSLMVATEEERLEIFSDEIEFFADGRFVLDDGTILTGQVESPDPLLIETRYGALQLPLWELSHIHKGFVNQVGMVFARIPAGQFSMGSTLNDSEKPIHQVEISQPFYLGIYPVTQGQWCAMMGANPSRFSGHHRHPVENVSWEDAQAFIKKLNALAPGSTYRLPTEAEWEYACRAGSTTRYYFGDEEQELGVYAWYQANSTGTTHPVGQNTPNPWGLYDMHGHVWEWVQDWHGEYPGGLVIDPPEPPTGAYRVFRGGYWGCSAQYVRAAFRSWNAPGNRSDGLGFRCLSSGVSQ